jgi:hypothetical protein
MDPMYHAGWSVLVTGVAREVIDAVELAALDTSRIPRWVGVGEGHVVSLSTELVSGRRVGP